MSALGEEITRLRILKNWNKKEAATACQLNPSIFSRIESGVIDRPSAKTLSQLANGFGVSVEGLASKLPQRTETLRVGFAHAIWAAPVVPLLMRESPDEQISFTSYGGFQPADNLLYKPHMYESNAHRPLLGGPTFGIKNEENLSGWQKRCEEIKLSPYCASDLLWLLEEDKVDCIIAAKHVFDSHSDRVLPCARIMDCAGGGQAILVAKKGKWPFDRSFSGHNKQDVILFPEFRKLLPKKRILKVFYGLGTSIEQSLKRIVQDDDTSDISVGSSPKNKKFGLSKSPVELRDWNDCVKKFREALSHDGAFLFVAWEPLISAIKSEFEKDCDFRAGIHMSDQRPMSYLSFDIMFKRPDASHWASKEITRSFLDQMYHNTRLLRAAIATQDKDALIIRQIAAYFNLPMTACMKSLSTLDFTYLYYPGWLEYARRA